jgi:hypothetical protein
MGWTGGVLPGWESSGNDGSLSRGSVLLKKGNTGENTRWFVQGHDLGMEELVIPEAVPLNSSH